MRTTLHNYKPELFIFYPELTLIAMENPPVKALPLFITWQHLHQLTKACETNCRQELNRYCSKYGVRRLNIYQLCQEYHLTRDQLQFHLSQ